MTDQKQQASGADTSEAPVTSRTTGGAGPNTTAASGLTGEPPAIQEDRHGGAGTDPNAKNAPKPEAAAFADTGPVVEGTGGGLQFERKASGTRAQPRKEQPTTPERAEIIEARRLELEINRTKQNPATVMGAGAAKMSEVGDRVRVMRNAATGWEIATIKYLNEGGGGGTAETDGGEIIALEPGRWEPAMGALLQPDRMAGREEAPPDPMKDASGKSQQEEAKSQQKAARPARARAAKKSAGKKSAKKSAKSTA